MRAGAQLEFFEQCLVEPGVYWIGQYRPISIRDQIVRSTFVVEQLFRAGQLSAQSTVVVAGAGAGGVAAAKKAAALGCAQVLLVDEQPQVMSLQAHCTTRWLDPVQYDWPALHSNSGVWPAAPMQPSAAAASSAVSSTTRWPAKLFASPLPDLVAGPASQWAADVQAAVIQAQMTSTLEHWHSCQVMDYWRNQAGAAGLTVKLSDGRNPAGVVQRRVDKVDALILATGFGPERVVVPLNGVGQYSGKRFWDNDGFQREDFGLTPGVVSGRLLVSGSGDGALQDFIRLVTGKDSAMAVWSAVERALAGHGDWVGRFRDLWHWEQTFRRSRMMALNAPAACHLLGQLHARFESLVDALLADRAAWKAVESALRRVFGPTRRSGHITLLVKCLHFDECYALNRVVALLLIKFIEQAPAGHPGERPAVLYQATLKGAEARGQAMKAGWGGVVTALLVTPSTCATTAADVQATDATSRLSGVHGIVVRHGLEDLPPSCLAPPTRLQPQWAPAHLP